MAIPGDFIRRKYINLTTFKKDGRPVRATVIFAIDGDSIVVHTGAGSGKVKRIRNSGRVLVQPSNIFGKPAGKEYNGQARLLGGEEKARAKRIVTGCCIEKRISYLFQDVILGNPSEIIEIKVNGGI
ncbi:MAG: PPOX class F420-dependent oxidoreductase [Nitrososphaerota archaeon]|jgi:PPOX class probable F420-dependent enzyme|nr:PPOX class F420-dependent oxidoreductase [Nitrososphaerota archaeon]MDG6931355.1 PPOX class F420-dependent oxidoreductase [Nitrososphaerota archaeon]MDG6933004.1 PPOX class F420-dependent oxidoreductase [Nitrososphaerota archaeon]MDG6935499.1 PPOX class F420-dependent oxidoreductase [Nitrososphaerota archaeon]MDG6943527.1 PPOX class F420-dependent oxidoreductase [Nitrososphaerota archaeon]